MVLALHYLFSSSRYRCIVFSSSVLIILAFKHSACLLVIVNDVKIKDVSASLCDCAQCTFLTFIYLCICFPDMSSSEKMEVEPAEDHDKQPEAEAAAIQV